MQDNEAFIPEVLTADEKLVLDEYRGVKKHGFGDLTVVVDHHDLKAVRYLEKNEGETLTKTLWEIRGRRA